MSKLRLSLGCWNYERTRSLLEGRIQPDGIDLNYLNMPVEETFIRMLRNREFDVAEMSLSSYTVSLFEDSPLIAIPVFPSRFFRHSCSYVSGWVAQSLYKAFCQAQQETYQDLYETVALKTMLPWLSAHVEEARRELGGDFWSYGFDKKVDTLSTFLRYSYEQGLSKHLLTPSQLFAAETRESFKI